MRLYVHAISSYRSDREILNIKKELKQKSKMDLRRKEEFIYAGLFGALRLQENCEIQRESELYLTSGFGNINILAKMNEYIVEKQEYIKLFDFINMLGNTTNFYVASELGIKGKSIFEISDNFTYFHTLISIYASILKNNNEVIIGAIDLASHNPEVMKRVGGVDESVNVVSSVMYQKVSFEAKNALCSLEFDSRFYTKSEIESLIENENREVIFSTRCDNKNNEYFETFASYVVNDMILKAKNCLYIECYEEKYKILKITPL